MASKRTNQDGGAEKGWTNKRTNVRWSFGMIGMAASVAAAKLSRADFTADDDGDGDANLYYDYMIDEEELRFANEITGNGCIDQYRLYSPMSVTDAAVSPGNIDHPRPVSTCSSFLAISSRASSRISVIEGDLEDATDETPTTIVTKSPLLLLKPQPVHARGLLVVETFEQAITDPPPPPPPPSLIIDDSCKIADTNKLKDDEVDEDCWYSRMNRAVVVVRVPLPVLLTSNILLFAIGFLIGRRIGGLSLLLQS